MNDPDRPPGLVDELVGSVKPPERIAKDRNADREWERLSLTRRKVKEVPERDALDVVHDDEQPAIGGNELGRLDDVGVFDPLRQCGFVEEHGDEGVVLRDVMPEALDGDQTRHRIRTALKSEVDRRHSARRKLPEQLVIVDWR